MIGVLRDNRAARRGLITAGIVCVAVLFAPAFAPYDPDAHLDPLGLQNAPPSFAHPFGTDVHSRDVFSRVLHGARVSLVVAALSVLVSVTLGAGVGLAAGLAGGAVDTVLMRLVDVALSVPRVFLLLMIAALWPGFGPGALVLILGLTSWFGTSRVVRGDVLSARSREYVAAARALGLSPAWVALRHVLPNVAGPVLVSAALGVGQIILIEAGMSYLGVGVREPTASLGRMIQEGSGGLMLRAPWIAAAPGLVIIAVVLAFSALSERLERALDPKAA